jgi:hydrogenase maturation protease
MSGGVLIAGIGNIFQTDDAFGVEVAGRLADHSLPDHVRVEDFGIRGVHLAYELLEGYDTLIIIDAVPMGEPPGTLVVMEPELGARPASSDPDDPAVDAHTMSPDVVLATLERLGGSVQRIFIVGCQPADLREGMGLTPVVEAVVGAAANLCLELLTDVAAPIRKGMPA